MPAVRTALDRAGLRLDDLDVVELNEAFAGQVLACCTVLDLDPERVCPEGGALALGHPWGASGAILAVRLFSQLMRRPAVATGWPRSPSAAGRAWPWWWSRVADRLRRRLPPVRRPQVLRDVSVRLTEHRIGVIGANGSGKSTFVRMLNGLVVPTTGSVRVADLDPDKQARQVRHRVGFCFTDPDAQIVMPTVGEDIAFGLRRRGLDKEEIADRVERALASYGLAEHRDHPAHLLSGGQKQLLAIASVLVTDPDLLVMDEPTTLLDLANARRITELVAGLPQQVVLVTHHLDLLAGYDRVLVFDRGRIVYDAPPDDAVAHYQRLMRA